MQPVHPSVNGYNQFSELSEFNGRESIIRKMDEVIVKVRDLEQSVLTRSGGNCECCRISSLCGFSCTSLPSCSSLTCGFLTGFSLVALGVGTVMANQLLTHAIGLDVIGGFAIAGGGVLIACSFCLPGGAGGR